MSSPFRFARRPIRRVPRASIGRGDLARHTLLNLDGPSHAGEDWAWWLESMGVASAAGLRVLGFDNYANVIQAALDGQGVALGFSGIIDLLLANGQLVRPIEARQSAGGAVYLVSPRGVRLSALAQQFHDWVLEEVSSTDKT